MDVAGLSWLVSRVRVLCCLRISLDKPVSLLSRCRFRPPQAAVSKKRILKQTAHYLLSIKQTDVVRARMDWILQCLQQVCMFNGLTLTKVNSALKQKKWLYLACGIYIGQRNIWPNNGKNMLLTIIKRKITASKYSQQISLTQYLYMLWYWGGLRSVNTRRRKRSSAPCCCALGIKLLHLGGDKRHIFTDREKHLRLWSDQENVK